MTSWLPELGRVAQLWLDPTHAFRRETLSALRLSTGLSERLIELALNNAFEELTSEKLSTVKGQSDFSVLHILPANTFTSWLPGVVITLLLGGRCVLKPSVHEPVFPRAWKTSLSLISADLAAQVELVAWSNDLLSRVQSVVAYGSDETLATLRAETPASVRFIGYGHKFSIAVLFKEALESGAWPFWREQALRDIEPFHLQGCLSPQRIYIEGTQLPDWSPLVPGTPMPEMRLFQDLKEVSRQWRDAGPALSCVGSAGEESRQAQLEEIFSTCPGMRICRLGEMQRPSLAWRNGGLSLVEELCKTPLIV